MDILDLVTFSPCATKLIAHIFHPKDRELKNGLINSYFDVHILPHVYHIIKCQNCIFLYLPSGIKRDKSMVDKLM